MRGPRLRGTLIGLELFIGATTMAGAIGVVPALPLEWLAGSPFDDYAVPALALGLVCGGGALAAAALVIWHPALGGIASVGAGIAMAAFELVDIAVVRVPVANHYVDIASYLQAFYFALGVAVAGLGMLLWREASESTDRHGVVLAQRAHPIG